MNIILARHGNTFEKNETPYWCGSKNDISLTVTGKEQAEKLAEHLIVNKLILDAVYCGPLKRTKEYAGIISKICGIKTPPTIDERLNELDYGNWAGLDTNKTIELYGKDAVQAWEDYVTWPPKEKGNWSGSQKELIKKIKDLMSDISKKHKNDKNILLVTSNGILKHFWLIYDKDRTASNNGKVKTGAYCLIQNFKSIEQKLVWSTAP